jgi:hypothetical protein
LAVERRFYYPSPNIARPLRAVPNREIATVFNSPTVRCAVTLRTAALTFADLGRMVFPCAPATKEPATKRGFYEATSNPATIRRWWSATAYNIGLRTGQPSRVWVLDIDGDDGEATLQRLEAGHGPLPPTVTSLTARGRHLWFAYTVPIQSSAGRVGGGIDVRADGGYIVAPPSIHPTGVIYEWSTDSTKDPAVAPDWLVQRTRKKPATISQRAVATIKVPHRGGSSDAYGRVALEDEIAELAAAAPGTRNHRLNQASFSLHQLVAGGELEHNEVFARLVEACKSNGLWTDPNDGPAQCMATIRSGLRAGMQHPRSRGAS